MSNYTNSLNELINTKKEIKDIIIESTGENPSEVFSYYPSYIRSAIATGGGSASEEIVNSYISAYLSAYNFIDQETLSSNSYLTSHQDLSSYATKSYVVDYVATYAPTPDLSSYVTKTELSAQSYLTSIPSEYITQNELSANSYITANDIPIEAENGVSSFSLKNNSSLVSGDYSVSLGGGSSVSGSYNVAEGSNNYINGKNSHVEGLYGSVLGGNEGGDYNEQFKHHCSHVEGIGNVSTYCGSHVEGTYNFPYIVQYLRSETGYSFILNDEAFISTIGVGTGGNLNNAFNVDETKAKNAVAVTNSGKVYIYGVGDYNGTYVFSYQGWDTENSASIKSLQEVIDELPSYSYLYSYVGEALSDIPSPDLSGYVSKTELSAQSYLTSIPSEYITQTELSSCGYITMGDVSACGYITLADVPGTDLSNYVTYSYATANYVSYSYATANYVSYSYLGDIEEITEYILGSGSSSAPENIYATKSELNAYVSKTSLQSMSYITMDDIDACGYITVEDIPETDLSDYPTFEDIENMGYITMGDIPAAPDLSSYVTKTELSSCGYITSIPSEYITQQELSANSYLTQHQDLSGYVSKTELSSCGYITSIPSEYITQQELSANAYLTSIPSEYITQTKLSSCGYITSIPNEYITQTELSANSYITSSVNNLTYYYTKTNINNASYTSKTQVNGMFSYDTTTGVLTITTIS